MLSKHLLTSQLSISRSLGLSAGGQTVPCRPHSGGSGHHYVSSLYSGISHIKLPGPKQRTILDESDQSKVATKFPVSNAGPPKNPRV